MQARIPLFLKSVPQPRAAVFTWMSAIESMARASIVTVVPLDAYRLLGTARDLSILLAVIGGASLLLGFYTPILIRRLSRRWTYTLGCVAMVVGPGLMAMSELLPHVLGMFCRAMSVVFVNTSLNLYMLDHIKRQDFIKVEPQRLAFMGLSWTTGPAIGIYLHTALGPVYAYGFSATAALISLIYFWYLRLSEDPSVGPPRGRGRQPASPIANIRQFLSQRRMRLAWYITFARSVFWTSFFVYPPIHLLQIGADPAVQAAMTACGQAVLFLCPVFGRMAVSYGARAVTIGSFAWCGALVILAGFGAAGGLPAVNFAALVVLATLGSAALDAVGNVPFLRFVRRHERAEMTSVFRTYIEMSQLVPSLVFTLVLTFAPVAAVLFVLGLFLLASSQVARLLPRGF